MKYDIEKMDVGVDNLDRAIGGDFAALSIAFVWRETPQGQAFWGHQSTGKTPLDIDALKDIKRQYMHHTGTAGKLKDMHVKAGDVVRKSKRGGLAYTIKERFPGVLAIWSNDHGGFWGIKVDCSYQDYTLISLAEDAQPAAQPAAPKTWGDMTDAEKGALLLAAHEGKVIEFKNDFDTPEWKKAAPKWAPWCCYRVKPEPVRETVKIYGSAGYWTKDTTARQLDTHRITFDTIDGEPDCSTIKMEPITKEESK